MIVTLYSKEAYVFLYSEEVYIDYICDALIDFLVDHFTAWRAVERFFTEFFSFLYDNMTCRCYLAFASLCPLLFALIIVIVIQQFD